MNVFFSVADFTLKKLCQFILKRTVAACYVDLNDSFLDNLSVNVCTRKASLHNIRLKHDVINDEFFPSNMIHIESVSISELDVHLQSLCSGMNYSNGLVKCVINGLNVVVVVMKKNTGLPAGDIDMEDNVTTVTSENASIQTIIDVSSIIRDDDDDDDEHIQHINYIKDWINALQYRFGITLSIRCASIKIIMRSSSSLKQSTTIGDVVCPRHLHGNGSSIIQLVLLTIIILSLWLPIFYNHYYLNYY